MKIDFQKVALRNFLSYGDDISNNEIFLNTNTTTLVSGKNGVGKSSAFLDSLCFALHGKAFRNIKKTQLVNSIIKKNCEVHLDFTINGIEYKVIRGMKPNIFEIYKKGRIIESKAATKDYQSILNDIIKCPYSTFTNMIVMGSASYSSFMNLPPAQRREIVSNILDIEIFNVMSDILGEMVSENKTNISEHESSTILKNQEITLTEEMNKKNSKENDFEYLQNMLKNEETSFKKSYKEIEKLNDDISEKTDQLLAKFQTDNSSEQKAAMINLMTEIKSKENKISGINKNIKFFSDNDSCSSCEQEISKEIKISKITEFDKQVNSLKKENEIDSEEMKKINKVVKNIDSLSENIKTDKNSLNNLKAVTKQTVKKIKNLKSHIEQAQKDKSKENEENVSKIIELKKQEKKLLNDLSKLESKNDCLLIIKLLLKDSGLKAQIIKQWLPTLNYEINKILNELEAPYSFELNEQFNETINSKYRDTFSYASFSEGEKSRIDFSVLFAFREVARQKASVDCNILILDEILDGSLDSDGTSVILNLFKEQQLSIFVVSHKAEVCEMFDKVVEIEKKGNFSVIIQQ